MKTPLLILTVLAVAWMGAPAPSSATANGAVALGCPPDDSTARELVSHFLTAPRVEERRKAYGVHTVRPADLVALTSAEDADACRRLTEIFATSAYSRPPYRAAFYKAGGVYFVTFAQHRSSHHAFRTGYIPVAVFDSDFKPIGGAAL